MSSRDPPRPPPVDKGKSIAKQRKRRNNYVLRIPLRPITPTLGLHMPSLSSPSPPTGLHNPTSIPTINMSSSSSQPPATRLHNPTSIPTIHMSSSSSQPPPIGLHTPAAAPRPFFVPPSHIPSSSSLAPHTGLHTPSADIGASPSPHIVPSPVAGDMVAPQPMVDPNLDAERDPPLQDRPMIEPVGRW